MHSKIMDKKKYKLIYSLVLLDESTNTVRKIGETSLSDFDLEKNIFVINGKVFKPSLLEASGDKATILSIMVPMIVDLVRGAE